ncbi:hypothetical protein [Aureimonas sp. ME7]|uniref:hypothetical protein n=1 Tax=Aureimonas sp. ME7 TaxID=2744252 RepID=UPI0015F4BBBC|nr:hypothetical protein [Aureimonas sp. ME7]
MAAGVDVTVGTCTIVVTGSGTLTASPDLRSLSTRNAGGQPARVRVSTLLSGSVLQSTCGLLVQINCFRVSLDPPGRFAQSPPDADQGVLFESGWRSQGAGATLDVVSALILSGNHELDLNLTATKSNGIFSAGRYVVDQTIRCE